MGKAKSKEDIKKDLTKLVASAKKGPAFGLALAAKADQDLVIETSRIKKGSTLMKSAKKAAGGSKATHGKLKLANGKVYFECAEDPPSGCLRKLKAHFKKYDVTAKIGLILPTGVIEADEDDAPQDDDPKAAVVKQFHALARKLMPNFGKVDGLKENVEGLISKMETILKADTFDQAGATDVLRQLSALDKPPPNSPAADRLIEIFKGTAPRLAALAKSDPSQAEAVKRINTAAKQILQRRPVDATALEQVVVAATRMLPKPTKAADADAKGDTVTLALDSWAKTTANATLEVAALHKVIGAACADQPGAGKVDKAFGQITDKLTKLNAAIDGSLKKAASGGDPGKQAAAKRDALKMATDVSELLVKDPVLSKLDDNPFQKIKAHQALVSCLADIQKELAA